MPTNSERALGVKPMPDKDRPIDELFRIAALEYAEADSAWYLMDKLRSATLERMKSKLVEKHGDMPDNKVTRLVKSSDDWFSYNTEMGELKRRANFAEAEKESLRMRERRMDREAWDGRSERKMGRSST